MSIFNLFGSKPKDLYSDTNSNGEEDAYMYRLENDGSYTPVTKAEYKSHTDQLYKDGHYDDIISKLDNPASGDNSGGGFFGWLLR
jgi:hypothetical protein